LSLSWNPQGRAPSDSTSFFLKKIPVLFFFTGTHKDYHRPSDTVDKINFGDMCKIAMLSRDIITDIADREERVQYTKPPPMPRPPIIGIQPAREPNAHGVAVARVTPEGPAAKGGMLAGDVIVSIASQFTRNPQDLRQLMSGLKAGKTVKVVVRRDDTEIILEITLGERPRGRRR
jgi:aminopeptidase YwaD